MYLVRLLYASTIDPEFENFDIEELIQKAKVNNKQSNITGILCFKHKYFLQYLEGSRNMISQTYQKIVNDKRHTNIILLNFEEISDRAFSKWNMAYISESNLTAEINMKYSCSSHFDPYTTSSDNSLKLMYALRDSILEKQNEDAT